MYDTFTMKQRATYDEIEKLNAKIEEAFDPTTFVLNHTILEARAAINELQDKCDHIWQDGVCIVCGKEEKK